MIAHLHRWQFYRLPGLYYVWFPKPESFIFVQKSSLMIQELSIPDMIYQFFMVGLVSEQYANEERSLRRQQNHFRVDGASIFQCYFDFPA